MNWQTVKDMHGGVCEIRMTPSEMEYCKDMCAEVGDPPCWELAAKTSDWPKNTPIGACDICKDSSNEDTPNE